MLDFYEEVFIVNVKYSALDGHHPMVKIRTKGGEITCHSPEFSKSAEGRNYKVWLEFNYHNIEKTLITDKQLTVTYPQDVYNYCLLIGEIIGIYKYIYGFYYKVDCGINVIITRTKHLKYNIGDYIKCEGSLNILEYELIE